MHAAEIEFRFVEAGETHLANRRFLQRLIARLGIRGAVSTEEDDAADANEAPESAGDE